MASVDRVPEPAVYQYLEALWRRRLAVVCVALLVPAVTLVYSVLQPARYRATAAVLVTQQNSVSTLAGVSASGATEDPERFTVTQAALARTGDVVRRTLAAAHLRWTPERLLAESSVSAAPDADLLTFSVTDSDRARAEAVVRAYATQFTLYRAELDAAAVNSAKDEVDAALQRLAKDGRSKTALYAELSANYRRLVTLQALQTPSAVVASQPGPPTRVEPRPIRNTAIAAVFGVALALAAGYLLDLLDTRIRSAGAVADALDLRVLGRLPSFSAWASSVTAAGDGLRHAETEAVRALRIDLDLAAKRAGARIVMLAGASGGEGTSSTCASLALSFARSGRDVAVVDLGPRTALGDGLFGVPTSKGLADIAFGRLGLDDALVPLQGVTRSRRHGGREDAGSVNFLSRGLIAAEARSALEEGAFAAIFDELRTRFDVVLVDSPALLEGPDALALGSLADGLTVVVKLGALRRSDLRELREAVDKIQAAPLGVVVTRAEADRRYRSVSPGGLAESEQPASTNVPGRVSRSLRRQPASDA